jgi:hypothetical protein
VRDPLISVTAANVGGPLTEDGGVAESALNRWHIAQGRGRPVLYGWTEAHACAGHAVVIAGEDGCLQCHIGRTGAPALTVVEWADGGDANQEEPACGAHYQP